MKILSPYKDYYDYLTGIYGEDPLIILDRRNHKQPDWEFPSQNSYREYEIRSYTLWIGNYKIECLRYGYNFYYGEAIFDIPIVEKLNKPVPYYMRHKITDDHMMYKNTTNPKIGICEILKHPVKYKRPKFLPDDIVIALGEYDIDYLIRNDHYYPILKNMSLNKFISPEELYQWIYEYISEQNSKREQHIDSRTDIQKIEGNGFDKKTSFRGI